MLGNNQGVDLLFFFALQLDALVGFEKDIPHLDGHKVSIGSKVRNCVVALFLMISKELCCGIVFYDSV